MSGFLKANPAATAFLALFLAGAMFPCRVAADADSWVSLAEQQYRQGNKAGALESFQRASWERPQDPVIHYNMGVIAESLGRQEEAADHYASYLRWDRGSGDRETIQKRVFLLYGKLAWRAYQQRDYPRALQWYAKAGSLYPEARAVSFNLGRVYEALGDWKPAEQSFKKYWSLSHGGEKEEAARLVGALLGRSARSYLKQGRFQEALAAFQEALKWDEGNSDLLLGQAQCEENLGFPERAAQHYWEFLKTDPDNRERDQVVRKLDQLVAALAESYLGANEATRAEAILLQGLATNPGSPRLHFLLARAYQRLDQPGKSVLQFEEAFRLATAEDRASYARELVAQVLLLADQAFRTGDYPASRELLQKARGSDPQNPLVAYNLARTHERMRDWPLALREYRRYLSLAPGATDRDTIKHKIAYFHYLRGADLYQQGDFAGAQKAFESALLIRPDDPALLYNLALVLERRGETKSAVHFLERYLQFEHGPEETRRVQDQIARMRRESPEGERYSRTAFPTHPESPGQGINDPDAGLGFRRQAYVLFQSGRWEESISMYTRHLRRFPADRTDQGLREEISLAYRELSRAALLSGEQGKAISALQQAREWSPADATAYLWEGSVYENLQRPEDALRIYQESLRRVTGPEERESLRSKVAGLLSRRLQEALSGRDYPEALRTLASMEPYLDRAARNEIHYQSAGIKSAMGRGNDALADYGLHLRNSPKALDNPQVFAEIAAGVGGAAELQAVLADPGLAATKGRAAAAAGDHPRAAFFLCLAANQGGAGAGLERDLLRSMDAAQPGRGPAWLWFQDPAALRSVLSEGERQEVLEEAKKTLEDLYRRGLFEEGRDLVVKIEALEPRREFSMMQALFEEKLGKTDLAIADYQRLLGTGASLPAGGLQDSARNRLCDLLIQEAIREYRKNNLAASFHFLRQAEALCPHRADASFNLGCIYLRQREPSQALSAFSRYLSLARGESPRKTLTQRALTALKRQADRSPAVRFDGTGARVDLIFEKPVSLGRLLAVEEGAGVLSEGEELLDMVLLAPYLEVSEGSGAGWPSEP